MAFLSSLPTRGPSPLGGLNTASPTRHQRGHRIVRILLVYQTFHSLDMGGVRLRRIARGLSALGHEVTVLCQTPPEPVSAPTPHPNVQLILVPALDLTHLYKRWSSRGQLPPVQQSGQGARRSGRISTWLNRWAMIPDKHVPWKRPAVRRGLELIRNQSFDLIFASIATRTSGLVGEELSRRTGIPLAVEFRDLWTGNPYDVLGQPTGFHRYLHSVLERRIIRQARTVITMGKGVATYLGQKYAADLQAPVQAEYNFYDPAEYPSVQRRPSPFVLSYIGAMYATRQPGVFFAGLHHFLETVRPSPDTFRFRWVGAHFLGDEPERMIKQYQLGDFVDRCGKVPHQEALRLLLESHAALVLQSPEDTVHVPGKLFEAIGGRIPILLLSPRCETAEIVETSQAGVVAPYEPGAVADAIHTLWNRRDSIDSWPFDPAMMSFYSESATLKRLETRFEEAICRS